MINRPWHKRKGGAERERVKRNKAADAASCCKIPAMFASKGTGDEGSSSSTSAANAPAVELEVVDSSAFESEQEPSEQLDVQSEKEKESGKDGDSESLDISFDYFAHPQYRRTTKVGLVCCEAVSRAMIPAQITLIAYKHQNALKPCVEAIIFFTDHEKFCSDPKARWISKKTKGLREIKE